MRVHKYFRICISATTLFVWCTLGAISKILTFLDPMFLQSLFTESGLAIVKHINNNMCFPRWDHKLTLGLITWAPCFCSSRSDSLPAMNILNYTCGISYTQKQGTYKQYPLVTSKSVGEPSCKQILQFQSQTVCGYYYVKRLQAKPLLNHDLQIK